MMLDIWMPEMDGMETLRRVRELVPTAQVMMMSGHGSIETAVKAIKLGAYDYIEKPLSLENVTLRVKHALDQYRLEQENRTLRTKVQRKFELVGQSPVDATVAAIDRNSRTDQQPGLDRRRKRHRKGTCGAGHPSAQHASRSTVCGGELRGDSGNLDRE